MLPFNLTTAAAALACPRCNRAINAGDDYYAVLHTYQEPHLCLWCATAELNKKIGRILPEIPLSFIKKLLRQQRLRALLGRQIDSVQAVLTETQDSIQTAITDTQTVIESVITEILPEAQETPQEKLI